MQITPTSPVGTASSSSSSSTSSPKQLTNRLFDVSAGKNLSPIDAELYQAILSVKDTDLSIQMQALVVDLLRLMATIRKQSMENMQSEANMALETSELVASAQRSQARSTANAELINASASMAQAAADIGTNAVNASKATAMEKKMTTEANSMDFSRLNPDGTPIAPQAIDAPAPVVQPVAQSAEQAVADANAEIQANADAPDPATPSTPAPAQEFNQSPQAKASRGMYLTNRMRNTYQQFDMYSHISQALSQMGGSVMKMIATSETNSAGQSQAEATIYQAFEHYLSTRQQINSGYANDMRDALGKLLQMVREVESARHQSASQIASI